MDKINAELANNILFSDPETGEELRPSRDIYTEDGFIVVEVENESGSSKWRHLIKTQEM